MSWMYTYLVHHLKTSPLEDDSSELLSMPSELSDSSLVGTGESLSLCDVDDNNDDDVYPDAMPDSDLESDELSWSSLSTSDRVEESCDSSVTTTLFFAVLWKGKKETAVTSAYFRKHFST